MDYNPNLKKIYHITRFTVMKIKKKTVVNTFGCFADKDTLFERCLRLSRIRLVSIKYEYTVVWWALSMEIGLHEKREF
jgi:hypothetical protein